jgi:hypothetical protein
VDVRVTIIRPRPESRLSGSTVLVATTSGNFPIRTVEFRLTRGQHSNVTVLRARSSPFGWVYELDTSRFPNGRYTITSAAIDETGSQTLSRGEPVTVDN